jgi:signal peptidase I
MPQIEEIKPIPKKFSNKRILFIILGIILLSLFLFLLLLNKEQKQEQGEFCYTEIARGVTGNSMEPLIKNGSTVISLQGYYDCNEVQKGDIVGIHFKTRDEDIIKRIMGMPGDKITIEDDYLLINDEKVKNSNNQYYKVDSKAKMVLTKPLKQGIIRENNYLVLSDNVSLSTLDSRDFGYVPNHYLISKIEL